MFFTHFHSAAHVVTVYHCIIVTVTVHAMIFKETQKSPISPLKEEDPKNSVVDSDPHYFVTSNLDPHPYPDLHQIRVQIRIK